MNYEANNRVQRTRHKVSGPLTADVRIEMKSIIRQFIISSLILVTILCCGCGTVSKHLVDSCTRHYPPVESFDSVYWKGNSIAVSYSVQAPQHPKQEKCAESYWAILRRSQLSSDAFSHQGVTLHRTPLPKCIKNKWKKLPITELSNVDPGKFYVWDFIKRQPLSEVPDVYRNGNWLYMRYSPKNGALIKHFCPSGGYIKPSKYPKLAILFPFAVVGDILTFPLVMLSPIAHWKD